ncbi:MAG TPA: glycosyltransferase family A protein [Gemmatimonadaceae bacterium]|nr:glycosyltransferase family A protein [Gemmatimonadaceae bacterium]
MFLNEERLLPRLLASLAQQTRVPELLLLVDDGSKDGSAALAASFAETRSYVQLLSRPTQARNADRLAGAAELIGFQWALAQPAPPGAQGEGRHDLVAKLDADLELPPDFFARIVAAFESDPKLGISGAPLAIASANGHVNTEFSQPWHVRGATKFYRRACWDEIEPLPVILGWDTIDEARAQLKGWHVEVVPFPEAPPVHLRPTGSHDGDLRGFRRRGVAAWGYGAHPLNVLASALLRMRHRPPLIGGLAYFGGWLEAALRRRPRAEPAVVSYMRRRQLKRLQASLTRLRPGTGTGAAR